MTDILPILKRYLATPQTKEQLDEQINSGTATDEEKVLLKKVTAKFDTFDLDEDGNLSKAEAVAIARLKDDTKKLEENDLNTTPTPVPPPAATKDPTASLTSSGGADIDSDVLEYIGTPGNYFASTDEYGYVTKPIGFAPFTVGPDSNKNTIQMFVGRNDQVHILIYPDGETPGEATSITEIRIPLKELEKAAKGFKTNLRVGSRPYTISDEQPKTITITADSNPEELKKFVDYITKNYLKPDDTTGVFDFSAIKKLKQVQFRKAQDDSTLTPPPASPTPENEGGLENLRKATLSPLGR